MLFFLCNNKKPKESRKQINAWVAKATRNLITKVFDPEDNDNPDTVHVIASTERARTELGWTPRESIAQCAIDSWNYVSKLAGKDATSATGLASQPRSPLASASPSEHAQSPATPATTVQEAPSPTAAEFLLDAALTAGSKTSAVPNAIEDKNSSLKVVKSRFPCSCM